MKTKKRLLKWQHELVIKHGQWSRGGAAIPTTYDQFRKQLHDGTLPAGFKWNGTTDMSDAARQKQAQAAQGVTQQREEERLARAGKTVTNEDGTTTYDAGGNAIQYTPSAAANDKEVWAGQNYGFQRAEDAQALGDMERQEQHDNIQAQLDVSDKQNADAAHGWLPGTNDAFGKLNQGLTSIADAAVEHLLPNGFITNAYRAFAPPGSKFHTEGSVEQKAVNAVTS